MSAGANIPPRHTHPSGGGSGNAYGGGADGHGAVGSNASSYDQGAISDHDRALDLLVLRATDGLSPGDQSELNALLLTSPDVDPEALDLAAAGATLAFLEAEAAEERAELPEHLRLRLRALAAGDTAISPNASALRLSGDQADSAGGRLAPRASRSSWAWLAAAAALAISAIAIWQSASVRRDPSPSAQLATFTREATDATHHAWKGQVPGFERVTGEVVWSDRLQRGFMLLSGLPANDPSLKQYQLWIVDPARDKNPVDGGVFDIAAAPDPARVTRAGAVIVPIDRKLPVRSPAAFALTVEKPGGVVVSAGPLVVVAAR